MMPPKNSASVAREKVGSLCAPLVELVNENMFFALVKDGRRLAHRWPKNFGVLCFLASLMHLLH